MMRDKNKGRPGYKDTKVGWIPEEWVCFQLGEAVLAHNAGIYKKKEFYGNGHSIVGVSDLYCIERIDGQPFRKVPLTNDEIQTYGLEEGELLYGESSLVRSGIARTVYVTRAGAGTAFAWHTRRYRLNRELLNAVFLFYYLQSHIARAFMLAVCTQTALTGITTKDYFQCPLPQVSLPEQEAIAEVLECWDKAIKSYEKKIEKNKNIKKGLMQRLLKGKQRLPGFSGEWKEVRLGEIGRVISGGTPSTENSDYWNGAIPWCTPTEIAKLHNKYICSTERCLTDQGLKHSSANLLPENSLIVCTRATVGDCALNSVPMATNQGFKSIIMSSDYDVEFIYFKMLQMKKHFIRYACGSTFLEVSKRDFEKSEMSIPILLEQRAIALVLSAADEEISVLDRKLASLKEQKRYLLNNLVTGSIRLPEFVKKKT